MLYNPTERHVKLMCTFLTVFAAVKGQSLNIVTVECERHLGREIQLRGSFPALPGDPVTWIRQQGGRPIASCQPNGVCDPPVTGYLATQSNSGLTHTLTISSAGTIDSGTWSLSDPTRTYTASLVFVPNLQGIQVTCSTGTQTGDDLQITDGSSSTLTCVTECTSDTLSLECFLEKDGTTTPFTSNTGPSACSGGNTWSSSLTLTSCVSGTHALVCQLTAGSCSYNDTGKNVTCSDTTTTQSPTTTNAPCTEDKPICNATWIPKIIYEEDVCIASDGVQIAFLILGVFILVAGIVLLVVTVKKFENGGCKQKLVGLSSVVIATSGISVILFIVVLAVEVATVSETSCLVENCSSESENAARNCRALEIAGFVFFGLAFSLLVIQVAALVYKKQRICQAQPRDAANGAKPKKDKPNGLELSSR